MLRRRKEFVSVASLATLALFAAGCTTTSGGNGGGGEDGVSEVTFAPGAFPQALDAQYYPTELAVFNISHQVMDTLVMFEDGEAIPALAESWENPDENTWVFQLRETTFSDGTDFTAEDAKASLERILELDGPIAPLFAKVDEITADDDRTLTITTSSPLGNLANSLSMVFIGQADKVDDDDYWTQPIGTGPFTVENYTADDRIELVRNDDYWGDTPELERVTVVNMPEVSSRITALQSGEIDVTTDIPPDQVSGVEDIDDATFTTDDSYKYLVTWFNHENEALDDTRVRQALTHAVDLDSLLDSLYGDSASPMHGPLNAAVFGAPALEDHPYDPDKARELLADAGYEDGLSFEMIWPNDAAPNVRSFAQGIISDWEEIGVEIEPFELERAQWTDRFDGKDYDLSLFENVTTTGDAGFTLGRLYTCDADRMGYCDEELDEFLQNGEESVDQGERETSYEEASQILWQDAVSYWLAELNNSIAYKDHLSGIEIQPTGLVDFSKVSTS